MLLDFLLTSLTCCLPAASEDGLEATDRRILQEVPEHNHLIESLEYLSDRIGPRLTGSQQLGTAEIWAADLAKQYGTQNVHLQGWKIAHSWRRGSAQARIVDPVVKNLTIASAGWSPGTPGQLRGKIVSITATKLDELESYSGKWRILKTATIAPCPQGTAYRQAQEELLFGWGGRVREDFVGAYDLAVERAGN